MKNAKIMKIFIEIFYKVHNFQELMKKLYLKIRKLKLLVQKK